MINPHLHTEKIRERQGIINVDINSQIKKYQKQLVMLSFSRKDDYSSEYNDILNKIQFLRSGLLGR